jgi:hypothetical protein
MATVNKCFKRDLKVLDPSYFVRYNSEFQYYEIKKKMDVKRTDKDNGIKVRIKDPTVATFRHLNDSAIQNMNKRKYLGRKYEGDKYLEWIKNTNKEARAKGKTLAREMVAEGFMEEYKHQRKKTVS